MVGPHKNGREKHNRKTENDVIGLDNERGSQKVEGELDIMASLDVKTCLGRQRSKKNLLVFFLSLLVFFLSELRLTAVHSYGSSLGQIKCTL